jgi:hypothetical protein
MEIIYLFAFIGAISLGILVYSYVCMYKEKRTKKA